MEVVALNSHPQRDESVVDDATARVDGGVAARTADFKMRDIGKAGERSNESRNVGCGMEQRWVLVDQKSCGVFITVFRAWDLDLWSV